MAVNEEQTNTITAAFAEKAGVPISFVKTVRDGMRFTVSILSANDEFEKWGEQVGAPRSEKVGARDSDSGQELLTRFLKSKIDTPPDVSGDPTFENHMAT